MSENEQPSKATTEVLVKSGFWYTLSGFLSKAIGFLTVPIFTRIFTKEQVGDFTVYASWQAILVIICGLEVYSTINRARFDYKDEKKFNEYISSSLVLSTLSTALLFVLFLIFPDFFYRIFLIDYRYMLCMFMYLFALPAFSMFQAKQRIEYKYKVNATITFAMVILSTLFAVFLARNMEEDRLFGRIIGQYSLYIVVGMAFFFFFVFKGRKVKLQDCKYAFLIGLPLVFSLLGSNLLLSSDNFVVKHLCDSEQVGYISIAHSCTNVGLILVQMINSALSPWLFDKLNIKDIHIIRRTYLVYYAFLLVAILGIAVIGPELVLILGGKSYSETLLILPANVINCVFSALTFQLVDIETFYKKSRYAAFVTSIMAIINIVLDIVFVKQFGYTAACYVTVACQVLLVFIHYLIVVKIGGAELLRPKVFAGIIIAAIMIIPIALLLYKNNIIRLSFLGVAVVCLMIIYRKKLKLLLGNFRKKQAKV